ncbi:MAG: hypothetical protein GXY50_09590 [Syntrophomonadaceae bacterium]|mgnify:CR=1 FL=1|nr:hypothetical protein [Syntrophomonadaceae bacterium]
MKRIKNGIISLILILLIFVSGIPAYALEARPQITKPDLPFISAHRVIKAEPVYRVLADDKLHWYTTSADEFNYWTGLKGINNDGIAAYISPVPLPYTVPMWNMVKNNAEQYFVTSEESRDYVIGKYGYCDCGIMGYVVALNDAAHGNAQLYQWYRGATDYVYPALAELYGLDDNKWDADHYYNTVVASISSYKYEGPQFRVWSDASTLQEIDVLSPKGGETLTGGSKVNIRWKTMIPGGNISLYYTLNPSEGWSVIDEDLENTGSYEWTVPNSAASKAIVEARWSYEGIDANCYDQSDQYFSIKLGVGTPINWALAFKPLAMKALLAPAAPSNLTAISNLLQLKPMLYWQDNSTNETGFVIERKSTGSYEKLAQVAADQTKYTDSSAEAGMTYSYRVKAVNNQLSSGYSNEVSKPVFKKPEIVIPQSEPGKAGQVNMVFTLDQRDYSVNGVTKTMDVSPVSLEGRTMLPIRFAADPIGAETVWNGTDRKVTVKLDKTTIELWIGAGIALVNGVSTPIDSENPAVNPIIMNDRTMLPMRFVAENLGCTVEWLPASKQINVNYPH